MGFTFDILPCVDVEPLLPQLAERAGGHLRRFIAGLPIDHFVLLSPELQEEARAQAAERAAAQQIRFHSEAPGSPLETTWHIECSEPGERAGTLSGLRFTRGDHFDQRLVSEVQARFAAHGLDERLERCRDFGVVLEVARSAGQPILASLATGFVAAALAELSEGVIYSDDGAWDPSLFPCLPSTFLASFMNPRAAGLTERYRRLAQDRILEMPGDLTLFSRPFVDRVLEGMVGLLVAEMSQARGNEECERRTLARAVGRIETVRVLAPLPCDTERQLLMGDGLSPARDRRPDALARLRPTGAEYQRWIQHLGELLP